MKPIILLPVLLFCFQAGPASASNPTEPSGAEARYLMGTVARVEVWMADGEDARDAVDAAFMEFARVDSLMSTWKDDSVLSRLNRFPAGQWMTIGPEVGAVLDAALGFARITDGAFDPTVLSLVRLWGFRGGEPTRPDSAAVRAMLENVGYRRVELSPDLLEARRMTDGVELDLGGIAKGYALDRAAARLKDLGAVRAILDLGGQLQVFGLEPGSVSGLVHPLSPDEILIEIPFTEGALATSGQYERWVDAGGRRWGHILDPRTGYPVPAGVSFSVVAEDGMTADALATAAVVLGSAAGVEFLEAYPQAEGVAMYGSHPDTMDIGATGGLETGLVSLR